MSEGLDTQIEQLRATFWSERDPMGRAFASLADAYRRKGDLQRALDIVEEGLGRLPNFASGHVVAGWVHRDLDAPVEAEEAFRRVLELDAENAAALRCMGQLARDRGSHAEAAEYFRRLSILDPDVDPETGEGGSTVFWEPSAASLDTEAGEDGSAAHEVAGAVADVAEEPAEAAEAAAPEADEAAADERIASGPGLEDPDDPLFNPQVPDASSFDIGFGEAQATDDATVEPGVDLESAGEPSIGDAFTGLLSYVPPEEGEAPVVEAELAEDESGALDAEPQGIEDDISSEVAVEPEAVEADAGTDVDEDGTLIDMTAHDEDDVVPIGALAPDALTSEPGPEAEITSIEALAPDQAVEGAAAPAGEPVPIADLAPNAADGDVAADWNTVIEGATTPDGETEAWHDDLPAGEDQTLEWILDETSLEPEPAAEAGDDANGEAPTDASASADDDGAAAPQAEAVDAEVSPDDFQAWLDKHSP